MGKIIKQTSEIDPIVVFANAVEDNPFMAGAFHGSGESIPGVVRGESFRGGRIPALIHSLRN